MSSTALLDLQRALKCVLSLEDLYEASGGISEFDKMMAQLEQDPFSNNNNNREKAFLSGGGNNVISRLLMNAPQQNQQQQSKKFNNQSQQNQGQQYEEQTTIISAEQRRKQEAKKQWLELDQVLLKLSSLEIEEGDCQKEQEGEKEDDKKEAKEWQRVQKLLVGINNGRLDKFARVATSADAEIASSSSSSASSSVLTKPGEILLGSASSAVSRSILHGILTMTV